ncbi:acyltransferase family protein [Aeromicrobium sp. CTD01-1L150]|uniref:acyltransferase family protein n=1 Tax=Aeromicrobium sp. CTD01-1L150 TaxID=3341830 RepID=UPI0035C09821
MGSPTTSEQARGDSRDGPARTPRRLPHVQGLRGIAVLLVVAYHAGLPVQGGFIGVDVFFVVSGFVITALLLREVRANGRVRFGRFYGRRVRRLLPALSVMLCVTLLASMALQSPFGAQQSTALTAGGASLWVANAALYFVTGGYFDASPTALPLLHTWSLAVEEQFYLVFPAVLAVGWWAGRRFFRGRMLRTVTGMLVLVCAVSFAVLLLLTYSDLSGLTKARAVAFYSAPTRAWEFAAGGLVAVWVAGGRVWSGAASTALGWVGALTVVGAAILIPETAVFPGYLALLPVVGTALVLASCASGPGVLGGALSSRPLTWLGDLSYSWYLWHWPFIAFSAAAWPGRTWVTVAAAVLALPVALVAYRYVEEPIRHGSGRRRSPTPRLSAARVAAVSIAVPLTLATVLQSGASASWQDAGIAAMGEQVTPVPAGYAIGCHTAVPVGERERDQSACTIGGDRGGRPIVLVGDSNAGQYADALMDVAEERDRPLILGTMSACPFVDILIEQSGFDWRQCRAFVTASLAWLVEQPATIVVTASANAMIELDGVTLVDPLSGRSAGSAQDKQDVWEAGLTRTLTALKDAGHQVLLVNVIPHLVSGDEGTTVWTPAACHLPELRGDVGRCSPALLRSDLDHLQALGLQAERTVTAAVGVGQLDLRDALCPGSTCRANDGDHWVYRDGFHITTAQSVRLAPRFAEAIATGTGTGPGRYPHGVDRARPTPVEGVAE